MYCAAPQEVALVVREVGLARRRCTYFTKYDVEWLSSFVAIARSATASSTFFAHTLRSAHARRPYASRTSSSFVIDFYVDCCTLSTPLPRPRSPRSRPAGMEWSIDVARPDDGRGECCQAKNCQERPTYSEDGQKPAEWCQDHRKDGMFRVQHGNKTCGVDG